MVQNWGTMTVNGAVQESGGTFVADTANVTVSSSFLLSGGDLQLLDNATLTLGDGLQQTGGSSSISASSLIVSVAPIQLSGLATMSLVLNGQITTTAGLEIDGDAVLTASAGAITGNVVNAGTLNLAFIGDPPLTIDGNYTQTGRLLFVIDGAGMSGSLSVSGTATLGGALTVTLLDGFQPSPDSAFGVVQANALSGTFATLDLPGLSEGTWEPHYVNDPPYSGVSLWVVDGA
jgi:hypothetical protein